MKTYIPAVYFFSLQSGFHSCRSTETKLAEVVNNLQMITGDKKSLNISPLRMQLIMTWLLTDYSSVFWIGSCLHCLA